MQLTLEDKVSLALVKMENDLESIHRTPIRNGLKTLFQYKDGKQLITILKHINGNAEVNCIISNTTHSRRGER